MGKSNRIKVNKQNERTKSLSDYSKKKKGMPNWAVNLIAIVVAVAILLSVAVIALTSTGTVLRMQTAMRSEHFRVNGNMMAYFFQNYYNQFLSSYDSFLSQGYLTLNTSMSLKDQIIQDSNADTGANVYDSMLCGVDEAGQSWAGRSWYDFLMTQTQNDVKVKLYYCEYAKANGWELTKEEKESIDTTIDSLRTTAASLGYPSLNSYLATAYDTKGLSEGDVRNCMEIESLYNKSVSELSKKIDATLPVVDGNGNISQNILDRYNADHTKYDLIDYTYYTFSVYYNDVSSDVKADNDKATEADILNAYKAKIAELKTKAETLMTKTDAEEFKAYFLEHIAHEEFDAEYETLAKGKDEGKLSDENLATVKAAMIKDIIDELKADKTEPADPVVKDGDKKTVYTVEVNDAYAEVLHEVKHELFDILATAKTNYTKNDATYISGQDYANWLFNTERKAGETYKQEAGAGTGDDKEITEDDSSYSVSVYLTTSGLKKNEEATRNVAYMFFATAEEANAAIEALKAEASLNIDAFNRIADEKGASAHEMLDNYIKGDMGNADFDNWLFDASTKVGSFTTTAITVSEGTYGVFLYVSEGAPAWAVNVKNAIFEELAEAEYNTMVETYKDTIKIKAKVCARVVD